MASVNPACTAALSCSTKDGKTLEFGELAGLDLGKPGIQPLSFALAQHLEKVLRQAKGRLQDWIGLAKNCQVHAFILVQSVWMLHEETHSRP
jgi:hypothetical protein